MPSSADRARCGTVALTSARNTLGTSQTAHFSGGVFEIRQHRSAKPVTDLYLRGGSLGPCRTSKLKANASSARRRSVRRLWGSGHGRFRTHGVNSVASVLGTIWLTQDTCAGTRTVVKRGLVAVRDLRRHRTVKVSAGHSYLARRR